MDKKTVVIYTMEYYSAIKTNQFESVLMGWMKLEPIIQSEVSQKEKHQYSILMHTLDSFMTFHDILAHFFYCRKIFYHMDVPQFIYSLCC